ncbi:MAG: type II toxin-antitoxin system RelE/ParE family toxin [Clostridiales bacterium]
MEIIYSKQAIKAISKMDVSAKHRIKLAIEKLPKGDVKLLKGRLSTYRLRIGDQRVLFSYPDKNTMLIEKIGPRGQI